MLDARIGVADMAVIEIEVVSLHVCESWLCSVQPASKRGDCGSVKFGVTFLFFRRAFKLEITAIKGSLKHIVNHMLIFLR